MILKSRINKRRPRLLTKQEMSDAISEQIIGNFAIPEISKLQLISMPWHVQLVIEAAGGPIRY